MFPAPVERWRSTAARVAPRGVPPSLVLAVIQKESYGRVGALGSSKDAGLMQVKPAVIIDYNRAHPKNPIQYPRMLETTPDAAADQIRVGSWLIAHHLKRAHKTDPARAPWPAGELTPWQVHFADLRYSRGGGAAGKLRKAAIAAGYPDDLNGWFLYRQDTDPSWGTPGYPFYHAAKIESLWRNNGGGQNEEPIIVRFKAGTQRKPKNGTKRPVKNGGLGGFLLVAAILWASSRS